MPKEGDPQDRANPADVTIDIWCWARRQAIVRMHLSLGAKECWRVLDGFPRSSCFPSHYYIAMTMGKSVSAVRRYLKELEQCGFIKITAQFDDKIKRPNHGSPQQNRPRGQTSNSYTMLDQEDLVARATQIVEEWYAKQQKAPG